MSTEFKKRKRVHENIRRQSDTNNEPASDEEDVSRLLNDVKDLQKQRLRPAGMSADELIAPAGSSKPQEPTSDSDPFKLANGGLIELKNLKASDIRNTDNIEDNIRHQFSKESHLRDEDEEMRKYVEEEIRRRKGILDDETSAKTMKFADEEIFQAAAARFKKFTSKGWEAMISNQMLSGIPEVNLGVETKIKNIEKTEEAKVKLLKDTMEKRRRFEEVTKFNQDIMRDMSMNYSATQHPFFDIEPTTNLGYTEDEKKQRLEEVSAAAAIVQAQGPHLTEQFHTYKGDVYLEALKKTRPEIR